MSQVYQKTCHLRSCIKPFESAARNSKYCSEPCAEKAKKHGNQRIKRRRGYIKDAPNKRAQSMSRREFRYNGLSEMAVCICQSCGDFLWGKDVEFHHRDGNPFNNHQDNRASLCHKCHVKADISWRQAKENGLPIPDIRNYEMRLDITGRGPAVYVIFTNVKVGAWEQAAPPLLGSPVTV